MTRARDLAKFNLDGQAVTINESSADLDFRVESNSNANMLFVDGGNNNVTVQSTSAGAAQTPFIIHNASSDANTDVRMLLAPCTTAADRPVILSAKNNGGNVVDFGISTPNGGTPVQRVTIAGSDGTIDVETGDIFFSTAGKGIVLGATSNTDANTLDDYEEGTFTPTITGSSSNPTVTYITQVGKYTKVGNLVRANIYLETSAFSGGSGNLQFAGLPFTSANITATSSQGSIAFYKVNSHDAENTANVSTNTTVVTVLGRSGSTASDTWGALQIAAWTNANPTAVQLSVSYFT